MTVQNNEVIEASAKMIFDGTDEQINVFQFRLASGGPLTDDEAIDDVLNIVNDLYSALYILQSILIIYDTIRLYNQSQSLLLGVHDWPTRTAGTETVHPIPPGVCALVNFTTAVPKVILRKFFGGFTEDQNQDDGTWNGTLVTAVALVATNLLAPLVGSYGTWEYGYTSPKTLGWVAPNGSSNNDIPAYQRRRKQGSGS